MLRKLVLVAVVAAILGLGAFWFLTIPATVSASALPAYTPNVDNGRTMFYAGGCSSCHMTPKQDDKTVLGGGLALKSPFGTFNVPNISTDKTDGIGNWNEAQFVTAMVKGTSPEGEHYFPAFPYPSYQRMKLEDVRDLFAYMKTLPAVQGNIPDHEISFPFNVRRLLGGWKLLFLDGQPFRPDPSKDAEWNRGAYLVNGPAHCAECHSPRNALGGIVSGQRFAGGPSPDGGDGWMPNITQHGLSAWTVDDLTKLLATGENRDADTVGGDMGKVVSNTGRLSEADQKAMAVYVKSLPAVEGPRQPEKK